jgi:nucleoid DNA-binding protein
MPDVLDQLYLLDKIAVADHLHEGRNNGVRPMAAKKPGTQATVTLKHLAANLAESHEMSKKQTETMLGDLVGLVTKHIKKGDRIRMGSLGTIEPGKRAARLFFNPTARPAIPIEPRRGVGAVVAKVAPSVSTEESIPESAYEPSARALALLRGKEICESDLRESGGSFTLERVENFLDISRQAIAEKVRDNALLAIPGPHGRRVYPVVQFTEDTDDRIVPGLKNVLDSLPSANGWFRLNFLVTPDAHLGGRRPIDLLKERSIEPVVKAAKAVGVQGA